MTEGRLTSRDGLSAQVQKPVFNPSQHASGIVHFGVGAFHKAHQAVYTDDALAVAGGDWRIIGVSLRSPKASEELNRKKASTRLCCTNRREYRLHLPSDGFMV